MSKKIYKDCVETIVSSSGNTISKEDAKGFLKNIEEEYGKREKMGQTGNIEQTLAQIAKEKIQETSFSAIVRKREILLNAGKEKSLWARLGMLPDRMKSLQYVLGGGFKKIKGIRDSIDTRSKLIAGRISGGLEGNLKKNGVWDLFISEKMDNEIMIELENIGKGGKAALKDEKAFKAAQAIYENFYEPSRLRMNRAGAWVRNLDTYITKQTHSVEKLYSGGLGFFAGLGKTKEERFSLWRDFIHERLDWGRMEKEQGGIGDKEEFLRRTYNALLTGVHLVEKNADSDALSGFSQTGSNLAKKASEHRKLHFKDATSFYQYNKKFGNGSLRDLIFSSIESTGKTLSLMETFGTKPEEAFQKLLKKIDEKAVSGEKGISGGLTSSWRAENLFKELTGQTRIAKNVTLARWGAGNRALQTVSKLGGVVLTSLSDLPMSMAQLQARTGDNYFVAWTKLLGGMAGLRGKNAAEQREIARRLGVGFDSLKQNLLKEFWSAESAPGALSASMSTFFKWSGLNWYVEKIRLSSGEILASDWGEKSSKVWGALSDHDKKKLSFFNLGESDWNLIRKHVHVDDDGRRFLFVDKVEQISDEEISDILKSRNKRPSKDNIGRERDRIATSLGAYYQDAISMSPLEPGAMERAITNQGTQVGTGIGEVLRSVMQFKAFPVSVGSKAIPSIMLNNQSRAGGLWGVAQMVATTTLFGAAAIHFKDLWKGKKPRENSMDLWLAAAIQGGGAGIYGDFLFGQTNRFGRGALATALGPTFSNVEAVIDVFNKAKTGEGGEAANGVFNLFKTNTPFINLFYAKAALDYLILWRLQDFFSPGSLQKLKEITKKNGQDYWLNPTEYFGR